MTKGITLGLIGVIGGLALLLVGSSLGAYVRAQVEEREAGAIACGDSVSCSRTDQVVKVTNTGGTAGHAIRAQTNSATASKAALFGYAKKGARGVFGKSQDGPGVYGKSIDGYGGHFYSGTDDAVYARSLNGYGVHASGVDALYVSDADFNGLMVHYAGTNGVWIEEADNHGVYVQDAAAEGVKVYNASGDGFNVGTAGDDGLYVHSASDDGVHIQDATDDGVYIQRADDNGVHVAHSDRAGVYVQAVNAGEWGGVFHGGVYAERNSGNIIEAFAGNYRRFKVENDGDVYCDGTFYDTGADFADMSPAVSGLEPTDVLVIGPDGKLALSSQPYSTAAAGVYSSKPGFVGGQGDDEDKTGKAPLAIVGIVPVKASVENGSICPGDLLTTSSTPGHAMKAIDPPNGTIIGKALESLESGTGTIKMLVTLQ